MIRTSVRISPSSLPLEAVGCSSETDLSVTGPGVEGAGSSAGYFPRRVWPGLSGPTPSCGYGTAPLSAKPSGPRCCRSARASPGEDGPRRHGPPPPTAGARAASRRGRSPHQARPSWTRATDPRAYACSSRSRGAGAGAAGGVTSPTPFPAAPSPHWRGGGQAPRVALTADQRPGCRRPIYTGRCGMTSRAGFWRLRGPSPPVALITAGRETRATMVTGRERHDEHDELEAQLGPPWKGFRGRSCGCCRTARSTRTSWCWRWRGSRARSGGHGVGERAGPRGAAGRAGRDRAPGRARVPRDAGSRGDADRRERLRASCRTKVSPLPLKSSNTSCSRNASRLEKVFCHPAQGLLGLDRVVAGYRQLTDAAGLLGDALLRLGDMVVC